MPEEMAMNRFWPRNRSTFKFWKWVEQRILSSSEAVIAVTPYFKEKFIGQGARKVVFIPNRSDVAHFLSSSKSSSASKFNQNSISKNRTGIDLSNLHSKSFKSSPVLIFTGEMDSVWYKPEQVAVHYLLLKREVPDLKLKLITRIDPEIIKNRIETAGVNSEDWSVEASFPSEIPSRICGASLGLILGLRPTGNWPVKFAEYVAAGVPVAVERETGPHLTHEVEKWEIGVVIDESDPETYRKAAEVIVQRDEYTDRCQRYAVKRMDIARSAVQYIRLYRQVL